MKVIEVQQGSPEWIHARLGIPTASQFSRIIQVSGKPSKSVDEYLYELVAESILGTIPIEPKTQMMERGINLEPDAINWYESENGFTATVRRVGFCLTDDETAGCSPDALVNDDGGLEIKAPSPKKHIRNIEKPDDFIEEHFCQVQGNLFVTGRKWWDLVSWHPTLPPLLIRVEPDKIFIDELAKQLQTFHQRKVALIEKIKNKMINNLF